MYISYNYMYINIQCTRICARSYRRVGTCQDGDEHVDENKVHHAKEEEEEDWPQDSERKFKMFNVAECVV